MFLRRLSTDKESLFWVVVCTWVLSWPLISLLAFRITRSLRRQSSVFSLKPQFFLKSLKPSSRSLGLLKINLFALPFVLVGWLCWRASSFAASSSLRRCSSRLICLMVSLRKSSRSFSDNAAIFWTESSNWAISIALTKSASLVALPLIWSPFG